MADHDDDSPDTADEYEYDQAHEEGVDATGRPPARHAVTHQPPPAGMHVYDSGGDYGYDSAHDRS